MIVGKRLKTAFTVNSQGKLSPIGENIFQFKYKKSASKKRILTKQEKSNERCNPRRI